MLFRKNRNKKYKIIGKEYDDGRGFLYSIRSVRNICDENIDIEKGTNGGSITMGGLSDEGNSWITEGSYARDSWIADNSYVTGHSDLADTVLTGASYVNNSIAKSGTAHCTTLISTKISCSSFANAYIRDSNIRHSCIEHAQIMDSTIMYCTITGISCIKDSNLSHVKFDTRANIRWASVIHQSCIEFGSVSFGDDFYADIVIYSVNQNMGKMPFDSKYAVSIEIFNLAKYYDTIVGSVTEAADYIQDLPLTVDNTTIAINLLQNLTTKYFATNKEGVTSNVEKQEEV